MKVKPRYKDSQIQTQFFNGAANNNNLVKVRSSNAIIDVTAQVGNIYRRIQAEKPILPNGFIDDVLYSGNGLCKNLKVNADFSLRSGNSCP